MLLLVRLLPGKRPLPANGLLPHSECGRVVQGTWKAPDCYSRFAVFFLLLFDIFVPQGLVRARVLVRVVPVSYHTMPRQSVGRMPDALSG